MKTLNIRCPDRALRFGGTACCRQNELPSAARAAYIQVLGNQMTKNKENFVRADWAPTDGEIELAVERLSPNWARLKGPDSGAH